MGTLWTTSPRPAGSADIPQWQPHLPPTALIWEAPSNLRDLTLQVPDLSCCAILHSTWLPVSSQPSQLHCCEGSCGLCPADTARGREGHACRAATESPSQGKPAKQIEASPGKKNATQQLRRAAEIAQLYNCLEKCQPDSLSTKECTWPSLWLMEQQIPASLLLWLLVIDSWLEIINAFWDLVFQSF